MSADAPRPLGRIATPFDRKFGAPRQAGLVPEAEGVLDLDPELAPLPAVRGLASFSHVWLIWRAHLAAARRVRRTVRPPRLGGNRRLGALATRSIFRPNGLGLSVVRLLAVESAPSGAVRLRLGGVDLVDGTPVLDVKPYLPWADAVADARADWAAEPPSRLRVVIAPAARPALEEAERRRPGFAALVEAVLGLDPRPGFADARPPRERHGLRLAGHEVGFRVEDAILTVLDVAPASDAGAGGRQPLDGERT